MAAGTITIQAVESGQTTLTKTFSVADMSVITAAYQSPANVSVNGTATRAQVWNYIAGTYAADTQQVVQAANTVPAVVPAKIAMT